MVFFLYRWQCGDEGADEGRVWELSTVCFKPQGRRERLIAARRIVGAKVLSCLLPLFPSVPCRYVAEAGRSKVSFEQHAAF